MEQMRALGQPLSELEQLTLYSLEQAVAVVEMVEPAVVAVRSTH
jgi:hypothetical protein